MIAFVAAFAAEKAGAGSIAQQFESSMIGVGLTFVLLTVASCISIETVKSKSVGPFQPSVMLTSKRHTFICIYTIDCARETKLGNDKGHCACGSRPRCSMVGQQWLASLRCFWQKAALQHFLTNADFNSVQK